MSVCGCLSNRERRRRVFLCLLRHAHGASSDGPHRMLTRAATAGAAPRRGRVLNRRGAGERDRVAALLVERGYLRVNRCADVALRVGLLPVVCGGEQRPRRAVNCSVPEIQGPVTWSQVDVGEVVVPARLVEEPVVAARCDDLQRAGVVGRVDAARCGYGEVEGLG